MTDLLPPQVKKLDAEQLAGLKPVQFSLNFTAIPDRFFAGNRLYFEVGMSLKKLC